MGTRGNSVAVQVQNAIKMRSNILDGAKNAEAKKLLEDNYYKITEDMRNHLARDNDSFVFNLPGGARGGDSWIRVFPDGSVESGNGSVRKPDGFFTLFNPRKGPQKWEWRRNKDETVAIMIGHYPDEMIELARKKYGFSIGELPMDQSFVFAFEIEQATLDEVNRTHKPGTVESAKGLLKIGAKPGDLQIRLEYPKPEHQEEHDQFAKLMQNQKNYRGTVDNKRNRQKAYVLAPLKSNTRGRTP